MILVDVTWSEWQPSRDRPRYEQIVKTLLQPPAPAAGDLGPVFVHQCYEEDRGDTSWVLSAGPHELPPSDVCQKPDDWLMGAEGLARVLAELDLEEATARGSDTVPLDEVPDWRKLFRTRIFMRADHFRAVAGFGGQLDYWILIDMRFQWIAQGSVLWHTSFTVWSDLPWSVHHRSGYPTVRDPRGLSARDASHLIEDYESSRRAFRDIIKAPDRSALRVLRAALTSRPASWWPSPGCRPAHAGRRPVPRAQAQRPGPAPDRRPLPAPAVRAAQPHAGSPDVASASPRPAARPAPAVRPAEERRRGSPGGSCPLPGPRPPAKRDVRIPATPARSRPQPRTC